MDRPLTALNDLIRELDELRTLADGKDDATLTHASLAVARALGRLSGTTARQPVLRARNTQVADKAVDEARRALAAAKAVLSGFPAARPRPPAVGPGEETIHKGAANASCSGCGRRFVVRYEVVGEQAPVGFPLACPWDDCDAVTEVSYPSQAREIEVVPAVQ